MKGIAAITVIAGLAFCSAGILAQNQECTIQYYVDSLFFPESSYSDDDVEWYQMDSADSDYDAEWYRKDSATIAVDTIGYLNGQRVIEVIYVGFFPDWCEVGKAILLESSQRKIELLYFYTNSCLEVHLNPAEIVEVDSVSVLFTRCPITGTAGIIEEKYWIWNHIEDKPVELKHCEVTSDALKRILPAGYRACGRFDIRSLSMEGYVQRPDDHKTAATGGLIALKYGIDNFSLQVISYTYDPKKRPNDK